MRGLAAYRRLLQQERDIGRLVEATRKRLAKDCAHPDEFLRDYPWEFDNGYGRQTQHVGKRCGICRATNLYGEWRKPNE